MKLSELQVLEAMVMKELVRRRSLGGYSVDAESLLIVYESLLKLVQHLISEFPTEPSTRRKYK